MKVGVIGFGRFGEFLVKNLSLDASVSVYDINDQKRKIQKLGAECLSLTEVCQSTIVILAVPISEIESVLLSIKDQLPEGTLVIDLCSVKEYPLSLMKKILPQNVEILGTHPMFGPDSAEKTLYGGKVVLCRERISDERYKNIKKYLQSHGLKIIESSAETHDQEISSSLVLTHFLGRGLLKMGADQMAIDTKGYRRLMKILETVENDSWQLFLDINKYNRFAKTARQKILQALTEIDTGLNN